MNYFAHAYRFLDDPHFATGTGVPDWLTACFVESVVVLAGMIRQVPPDDSPLLGRLVV